MRVFKIAIPSLALMILCANPILAGDFKITFDWSDLKLCTSGNPNYVNNPRFTLENVPKGTKFIKFSLTDLDVPSYNHGGGSAEYKNQTVIEPGVFKYNSPCPPSGSHTYEWVASAEDSDSFFSDTLGKVKASKVYP